MIHNKLAVLEITSWRGISIGAQHWYGKLCFYDGEYHYIRLNRRLNTLTAIELNRQSNVGRCKHLFHYGSGGHTESFETREHVRQTAHRKWKKICPEAMVLLEGRYGVCDPQRCISGPAIVRTAINAYVRRVEIIGGWEGNKKAMQKVSDAYDKYLEGIFK